MKRVIPPATLALARGLITGRQHTDRAIARITGVHFTTVARYRRLLNLPRIPQPDKTAGTVEEQWRRRVRPAADGHMEWTGAYNSADVPTFSYHGTPTSARVIAFRIRTGRTPVGYVKAVCDHPGCVAPRCVEDKPGRDRLAQLLAAVGGPR
ncbi:hypothetical protein [Streptomyces sp. NBC_01217]|uniref:hypothetical protein n=1 Tax=Streptomyces sp. NBC_01217 TaxID=2903779 RepID=UPI002E1499D4|nr:hypothetical protein OG507_21115 [Streptomyces sp. NBC_01217]